MFKGCNIWCIDFHWGSGWKLNDDIWCPLYRLNRYSLSSLRVQSTDDPPDKSYIYIYGSWSNFLLQKRGLLMNLKSIVFYTWITKNILYHSEYKAWRLRLWKRRELGNNNTIYDVKIRQIKNMVLYLLWDIKIHVNTDVQTELKTMKKCAFRYFIFTNQLPFKTIFPKRRPTYKSCGQSMAPNTSGPFY